MLVIGFWMFPIFRRVAENVSFQYLQLISVPSVSSCKIFPSCSPSLSPSVSFVQSVAVIPFLSVFHPCPSAAILSVPVCGCSLRLRVLALIRSPFPPFSPVKKSAFSCPCFICVHPWLFSSLCHLCNLWPSSPSRSQPSTNNHLLLSLHSLLGRRFQVNGFEGKGRLPTNKRIGII